MRDVGKNCEQRNLVRSLDAKSKTVAEVSGRCHSECQITVVRRSGPLDRIVRHGPQFCEARTYIERNPSRTQPLAEKKHDDAVDR